MNWQCYRGEDQNWNQLVRTDKHSAYLHSSFWSNHMNNLGWKEHRFVYISKNTNKAFSQCFSKKYFGLFTIIWFPDWILGDYKYTESLLSQLKELLNLKSYYVRIRSHNIFNEYDANILNKMLNKVVNPIDSSLTMMINLSVNENLLEKQLSKNWRRNLKRSLKINYEITEVFDKQVVYELYEELSEIKNTKDFFSKEEISSIFDCFKDRILVLGARTTDGKIHAIRGAIKVGSQSVDIFAAADKYARKYYLSYRLFWELLIRSKELKSLSYDLNGVDENNMGVYNFKKGTGAVLFEKIGEYDYCNSSLLRFLVSVVLKYRA